MKYAYSLAAFAAMVAAIPAPLPNPVERAAAAVTIAPGSNIFSGRTIHANKYYASEISTAMASVTDATVLAAAAKIAKVGTFLWM
jgi:cellulose 1,4-beta-cellobiosidase